MPGPIGRDEFTRVSAGALELGGVDGVEVLLMHQWGGLTRFAASSIHQSTAQEDTEVRVRVVTGDRVGVAATNDLSPGGAESAARSAKEMADVVAPDPRFPGLAPAEPVPDRAAYDEATATTSPDQRAAAVAELVARCPSGFEASGAYETIAAETGVANTNGQLCWAPSTQASLTTVVTGGDDGSGFAEAFAVRANDLEPAAIGRRAAGKAQAGERPRPLDPGTFTVVLEPAAVATLTSMLSYVGFSGRSLVEGRSCLSGRQGERVAAPAVSILDDATSPEALGVPFDFEGVPRKRTDLIAGGVFVDGVYDRRTGADAERPSTGHALPAPDGFGPLPLNLFMAGGDASLDELIASTEQGLLVTRFHYTNVVNPMESSITGMTRDGTFAIENGELAGPVNNLRFTQSILEALDDVSRVGSERELASEFFFSASVVPALKIDRFRFTGRSDH